MRLGVFLVESTRQDPIKEIELIENVTTPHNWLINNIMITSYSTLVKNQKYTWDSF